MDGNLTWLHDSALPIPLDVVTRPDRRHPSAQQMHPAMARALWESPHLGLALVDEDGAWVEVNRFLCDDLGASQSQLAGLQMRDFLAPPYVETPDWATPVPVAMGAGDPAHRTYYLAAQLRRFDGTLRPVHVACERIALPHGTCFFLVISDATAAAALAQQLQRATEAAEQTLAVVAHDLRTPLAAVLMSGQLLHKTSSAARAEIVGSRIVRSARQALQLTDDLLEIRQWQDGAILQLQRRPCRLDDTDPRDGGHVQNHASRSRTCGHD